MKKLMISLLALGTMGTAFSATTATLTLQGIIADVLNISIAESATNDPQSLDLTTTQANLNIATVTEESNSGTGYKILVRSTGDANLLHSSVASPAGAAANNSVGYSLRYDNVAVAGLTTTDVTIKTVSTGAIVTDTSALDISYTGVTAASMLSGTYSDTLTFTIQAN